MALRPGTTATRAAIALIERATEAAVPRHYLPLPKLGSVLVLAIVILAKDLTVGRAVLATFEALTFCLTFLTLMYGVDSVFGSKVGRVAAKYTGSALCAVVVVARVLTGEWPLI